MIIPYEWLRFDKMQFSLSHGRREKIYKEVGTYKIEMLDGQGKQIYSKSRPNLTWLQKYFLDHGTWPGSQ